MSDKPKHILDKDMTEGQKRCADLLDRLFLGCHHVPTIYEWGSGLCVNYGGDLSTHDFDRLTRMVLLCHQYSIRGEIGWSGPGMVRLMFHPRFPMTEGMGIAECHPTLQQLKEQIDKRLTV